MIGMILSFLVGVVVGVFGIILLIIAIEDTNEKKKHMKG